MTFLHPALLASGLAAIAIPIIIHLLMNRRRKPVMWGAMRFLEEAFRRTRKRLLLEKWLLLAARCLLLALLALAIGRPLLGSLGGAGGKGRTFFLVIDNSIAAQATDDAGRAAMSRHIAAARDVLATLRPAAGGAGGDRVALITLAHPAEGLVLPASPDAGAVASLLEGLEPADSKADFAGAMGLIAAALSPDVDGDRDTAISAGSAYVVMLSDFLEGSADLGPGASGAAPVLGGAKLPRGVTMLATEPAPDGVPNVSVVGVEPLRAVLVGAGDAEGAGVGEQVRVMLRRSGPGVDVAAATVVRARLVPPDAPSNDSAESRVVVRWSPGQELATTAIALPPLPAEGLESAMRPGAGNALVITVSVDRDALDADNTWRRPVEVRDSLRVGIVAPTRFSRAGGVDKLDAAAWIRLALSPRSEGDARGSAGSGVQVLSIEPASMDSARLAGLDAVILPRPDLLGDGSWARVRLFIEGGGLVLVMPPPDATVHLWGDEMIRVLEPGFALAREATTLAAGAESSRPVVVPEGAAGEGNIGLLSLIEGELAELLRPVTVSRVLTMTPAGGSSNGTGQTIGTLPGQTLLSLQNGTPLLWVGTVGVHEEPDAPGAVSVTSRTETRGVLAYLATSLDLEWTSLPTKPLIVPLLNELVLQGVGRARGATWTVAGTRPAVGRRATELLRSGGDEGARSVRIGDDGFAAEPIRRSGVWQAQDERGMRRAIIAVNPDAAGALTGAQSRDALQSWLAAAVAADGSGTSGVVWLPRAGAAAQTPGSPGTVRSALAAAIGTAEQGSPISFPLLVAVLSLGLVELVLGRRASHASIVATAGAGLSSRKEAIA